MRWAEKVASKGVVVSGLTEQVAKTSNPEDEDG
jgi:hypothetical protein